MTELILSIKKELMILLLAAAPISEIRGAIPAALGFGFEPWHAYIIGVIGNLLPIPFLLKLLNPMFDFFGRTRAFGGIINWIKRRTLRRSDKVEKYSVLGLFLLVAIPLPTTGAWTGSIAASLFDIKFRHAFPAIVAGVMVAGIIVLILSTQAISLFEILSI